VSPYWKNQGHIDKYIGDGLMALLDQSQSDSGNMSFGDSERLLICATIGWLKCLSGQALQNSLKSGH
jgi:class 3 adenylate cyclase